MGIQTSEVTASVPVMANNVLAEFVRALAKRQARIDASLQLNATTDGEPRTLH